MKILKVIVIVFDIYSGEHFEESVSDQIEFFEKHL